MDLKLLRVKRRLSQWALCQKCDIHQSTISLIENGYKKPSQIEKEKLSKALDVDIDKIDWVGNKAG